MYLNLRKELFWLLDRLKGSKIGKHYKDIAKINRDHGSKFSTQKREEYLSAILLHCTETVPYYRDLAIEPSLSHKFPITNKNLIKSNPDSFCSDAYLDKKTFAATTSGSTGIPFTVFHDTEKKRRHTADVSYFWETVGHSWGEKFYYLKIWNDLNKKNPVAKKIQNIVPVDVFKLNDHNISELLNTIKSDSSSKSILGYASALDQIVKYLYRNPIDMFDAGVTSIVAMSESLDRPTKNALKEHFRCPVVSRYANIENGMLAQQTAKLENRFLANLASYHIEILDMDKDIPVPEGQTGRIVVTDLFNRAMPMIRYDTGDVGVMGKLKEGDKIQYVLEKVEGRKMDTVFDTRSEPISSFTITNSMWKYPELAQYRFIQVSKKKYIFELNALGEFQKENELIAEFKDYLGDDADIQVKYVSEIPLLSSGKRKKVLNKSSKTLKG